MPGKDQSITDRAFSQLLSDAGKIQPIKPFVALNKTENGYQFSFTEKGNEIDRQYQQAFRTAEEKGAMDREVVSIMSSITSEWPSYPGVVENKINELIEGGNAEEALAIAKSAVAEWMAIVKKEGIKNASQLSVANDTNQTFTQLLANYEFALERANKLEEALGIAQLSRIIDPTDPENLLSAVISLSIRIGNYEDALRELEPLADSLAPFVLYGRALSYFALNQRENAHDAIQIALRHWPQVAQGISREWQSGLPMPKPGEAVSEMQVLYGYYEVFGSAWASVGGAQEWLREEELAFQRSGNKVAPHIGLSRSGEGNLVVQPTPEQAQLKLQQELITKARTVGENSFVKFLEVAPNEYVYINNTRGNELEQLLQETFRRDLKRKDRIEAIKELLKEWPGHANAAVAVTRLYNAEKKFEETLDILEAAIFDLQSFWPEDLMEKGHVDVEWRSNQPLLLAYAHMVVNCAETGDTASAKNFAADYLALNPLDNLGVRQKAIELYLKDGEADEALKLIEEAKDPQAAYNMFGKALSLFMLDRKLEATEALHTAIQSRPKIYHALTTDARHRMPPNYNPGYVSYFSNEEAYNYYMLWSDQWRRTMGALAWLRKEGKKASSLAMA